MDAPCSLPQRSKGLIKSCRISLKVFCFLCQYFWTACRLYFVAMSLYFLFNSHFSFVLLLAFCLAYFLLNLIAVFHLGILYGTSVANVRASEPVSQTCEPCEPCEPNVRALWATKKQWHDRLCSLSFRSLASPLSRSEKYEIQTMGVMSQHNTSHVYRQVCAVQPSGMTLLLHPYFYTWLARAHKQNGDFFHKSSFWQKLVPGLVSLFESSDKILSM